MTARVRRHALVTGASGFIGRHLVRRLLVEGWTVTALVRPTTALDGIPAGARIITDSGDNHELVVQMQRNVPDLAIHLASRFLSNHAPEEAGALVIDNVLFPTRLLEGLIQAGCRHFINTGTAWQHFDGAPYAPANLYAATKQAFADVLRYYALAQGVRTITLELVDTYGPDDERRKLIRLLCEAAQHNEVLALSPGAQLLDMVHVDDVVAAYLVAAQRLLAADFVGEESWSVASGTPMSLREVVELFRRLNGGKPQVSWGARPYRPREVMQPWIGAILPGWHPAVPLQEGLLALQRKPTVPLDPPQGRL